MDLGKARPKRHAISRAQMFLALADKCSIQERDICEAFIEAAIVFGRTAIHRLQSRFKGHPNWKPWFESLLAEPSVMFFRRQRDHILKDGPPKIGQIIGGAPARASDMYYFEDPTVSATATIRQHLTKLDALVADAETRFSLIN